MHPIIDTNRAEVAALCQRSGVTRLEVFGSAARDDFDESRSDIDFLVEFDTGRATQGLRGYLDFKEDLEQLFGRPVDLVAAKTVRNPYIRATINRDRQLIYAAA
jgi:uncharacterized protein